jgi:ribosome-associated toxin RatA of RatAB toxin-antitoxin module
VPCASTRQASNGSQRSGLAILPAEDLTMAEGISGESGGPSIRASVALLALVCGLLAAAAAPPSQTSDDVRRRLAAGEIVVSEALPPAASATASGGTAVAIVRASPEEVWRVIVDYRGHPRYYPRVTAAEVVESDARHVVVRYRVAVFPFSFGFYMDKYPDPVRRRVEWHLADGRSHGLFRENSGYWQVDVTDAADTSLVTYAIAVRTMLPAWVTGGAERASLIETVTALRKLVEARP